jgi:hypothetical protein
MTNCSEKFFVGCVSRTINSLIGGRGRPPYNIFHNLWVAHRPMRNCLEKFLSRVRSTHHYRLAVVWRGRSAHPGETSALRLNPQMGAPLRTVSFSYFQKRNLNQKFVVGAVRDPPLLARQSRSRGVSRKVRKPG